MRLQDRIEIRDRKVAILEELLKLAVLGKMSEQASHIFERAGVNRSTFKKRFYDEERALISPFCVINNRKPLFFKHLFKYAKSGSPFSVTGLNLESGFGRTWSLRCDVPGLHDIALKLSDANQREPGKDKTATLEKWMAEAGIEKVTLPKMATPKELKSRIDALKSIDFNAVPEEFDIAEPSDHMSASEVKSRMREHRRQSRESYFDHRPEMKLSPLPPAGRQTSRRIAS